MKKFEIYTDHFEFRFPGITTTPSASADEIWAWYQEESCNQPNRESSFDTIEEAKAEFQKNYANYGRTTESRAFTGTPLLVGDVAYLEENIYDDDGEFIQSVCIWNYSAEPHQSETLYRIRPEFYDLWTDSTDYGRDSLITAGEVERLARDWAMPISKLMEQVEEAND